MKIKAIFLLFTAAVCLHAEDWTTTDGKTYKGVSVEKVEPDAVTILDDDGGALVPLAKLTPDLQKRFGYDPAKAAAAADARAKADAASNAALQAEMNAADAVKAKKLQAETIPVAATSAAVTPRRQNAAASSAQPALSEYQRKAIQSQIDSLNDDISFMQREEAKVVHGYLVTDGNRVSRGGYSDKIADEQAQIQQLQGELAGAAPVTVTTAPLGGGSINDNPLP
jgi:hypothetical protein